MNANLNMKTLISVKKLNGVTPWEPKAAGLVRDQTSEVMTIQANLMSLGYIMSDELVAHLKSKPDLGVFANDIMPVLRSIKGADVVYAPMYPNFPKQVMEASSIELFVNAIFHYWSDGMWMPDYEKLPREFAFETLIFKTIDLVTEDEFVGAFDKIVTSNESLSDEDKGMIEWFMDNYPVTVPSNIPYKETMCIVAGKLLERGQSEDIVSFVKTPTDVLRIATYLSDGDVSLADKTKYKSLSRPVRRTLVRLLEGVLNEEDISRHSSKWVRLAHSLHVGDYSTKVYDVIKKVRENVTIETFNSKVEASIDKGNTFEVVRLLKTRPGEFARRVDKLLRQDSDVEHQKYVVGEFVSVADNVSTKVLLQLLGHFSQRAVNLGERIVFPKGSVQNAMIISGLRKLDINVVNTLVVGVRKVLTDRFSTLDSLGKVYVDPQLINAPIPTQQRSASKGMFSVARGTRLPVGDKNTLRFFIYWKGNDIDLSATLHDHDFNDIGHVSYTALRSAKYQSYHSGDITWAPEGACEFIDITMDGAYEAGARYVAMNVLVYAGPKFSEHEVCYAGWMTREHVQSNEIFDAKTVAQKIDVCSETRNVIPVVFDLKTREAIWVDMPTASRYHYGGNNVESNRAGIQKTVKAIINNSNKVSLYDLFTMHADGRGELVNDSSEADTVFSLSDGVTPFDINTIQSEYVSD